MAVLSTAQSKPHSKHVTCCSSLNCLLKGAVAGTVRQSCSRFAAGVSASISPALMQSSPDKMRITAERQSRNRHSLYSLLVAPLTALIAFSSPFNSSYSPFIAPLIALIACS